MSVRFLVPAAALLAGLGLAAPAQAATNLILNGSFETGDFTSWSYSGVVGDATPAVVLTYNSATPYPTGAFGEAVPTPSGSASPDPAGTRGAYFVSDFADETIQQTSTLGPGAYTYGFSYYVPNNGYANPGEAELFGTVAGQSFSLVVSALTPGQWYNWSGTFSTAVAGNWLTSFTFRTNSYPAKDIVIDQVYVTAVPEASTWAMMAVGFLGLAMAARKTRRLPAFG